MTAPATPGPERLAPEAVSFVVTVHHKLAKGQPGITHLTTRRIDLAEAFSVLLDELPDEACTVALEDTPDGWDKATIVIDWSKVPDSIRAPKLPARRR